MEWISVKDRLPDDYMEVLTWRQRKKCMCIASYSMGIWEKDDEFNSEIIVSHWMPLPPAPPISNN